MTPPHRDHRPKWPDEHTEALKPLWTDGKSASECTKIINAEFGTVYSRCAIIGRVHRMAMPARLNPAKPSVAKVGKPAPKPAPPIRVVTYNGEAATPFRVHQNGTVVPEPTPRPPTVRIGNRAFQPLPGTSPRPWDGVPKSGLCKWPIDVDGFPAMACCAPTEGVYCQDHHDIGVKPEQPKARDLRRLARAYG